MGKNDPWTVLMDSHTCKKPFNFVGRGEFTRVHTVKLVQSDKFFQCLVCANEPGE